MGKANAVAVMLYQRNLDHRPMRLLVHMALTSLDPGVPSESGYPPCLYWQGWDAQALALGYAPDVVAVAVKASNSALRRRVRAVRAVLVGHGAITLERKSAPGRHPTWRVITDPLGEALEAHEGPPMGAREGPPMEATQWPPEEK